LTEVSRAKKVIKNDFVFIKNDFVFIKNDFVGWFLGKQRMFLECSEEKIG
jgi:hypothetical protein